MFFSLKDRGDMVRPRCRCPRRCRSRHGRPRKFCLSCRCRAVLPLPHCSVSGFRRRAGHKLVVWSGCVGCDGVQLALG